MTKEELKEQFAIECTTLDGEGYTIVKGTPMDIINWISEKFCLSDVSGSWLDHHVLNEDSEIDGVIIKHSPSPEIYGGVAVQTNIGNFAIVKEHQQEAANNKGERVRVKPHKEYYGTVMILKYHDR